MNVGLLTTSHPSPQHPHSGVFVDEFAGALRARGHCVDVLAPADSQVSETPGTHWIRYLPSSLRRTFHRAGVPDNLADPLAWPGLMAFPPALAASALRRAHRWDAIVSHFGIPCGLAGAVAARGRPHLIVWHSADVQLASRVPGLPAFMKTLDAQHWVVSERSRLALGLGRDAIVAPMGANAPAERSVERRPGPLRVLSLGRLVPIKGLQLALRASEGLDLQWHIAGDGPERLHLARLAERRSLNVRFHGFVQGDEKAALFEMADLFIVPSLQLESGRVEGAPVALLEAQLSGLPILASRSGALVERVRHGVDGWLLAPNEKTWRRRLQWVLAHRADLRATGARARRHNLQFTWSAQAPRIERALAAA